MSRATDEIRLDPARWEAVLQMADRLCRQDHVPALAIAVGRADTPAVVHLFGRQQLNPAAVAVREDAIFLVASITKPIVAMGVMLLVERGEIALGDRVSDVVPEFARHGKVGTTLRHLLTHTSGLPDMLPDNRELRAAHSPLSAFVAGACESKPDFNPGRGVQYQSMGFAMLGEIIERVSGRSCAEFLRAEFFDPLGMHDTALGAPDDWVEGARSRVHRIAEIRVPDDQQGADWNWNSRYWRTLGAPWGGLLTTPRDLARFAQMMLCGGRFGGRQLLSTATVAAATRNQLEPMRDVPEADRRTRPWGFGWRLNWAAHSANFGDLLGPRTYGHWGATGTVLWIDPERDLYGIILSTQPQEPDGRYLSRLSNMIAAAVA